MVDGDADHSPAINHQLPNHQLFQRFREPFKAKKSPNPAARIPETSSQIVRSVGDPLKVRETSDANELEALMPRTISSAPAANNVIPRTVFIVIPFSKTPVRPSCIGTFVEPLLPPDFTEFLNPFNFRFRPNGGFIPTTHHRDQALAQSNDRRMTGEDALDHPDLLASFADIAFFQPPVSCIDVAGISFVQRAD